METTIARFDGPINSISVDQAGQQVVLGARKGLYIAQLDSLQDPPKILPLANNRADINVLEWGPAPNSALVAGAINNSIHVWDTTLESRFQLSNWTAHTRPITEICWSPHNPNLLLSGSQDLFIHAWDVRDESKRPVFTFRTFTSGASNIRWNFQDEHTIASAHEGEVRLWDTRQSSSHNTFITAHMAKITSLDWSRTKPDELVTCALDKYVRVWNTKPPKEVQHIFLGFPAARVRYTPFGSGLVLCAQRGNSQLHVWSLATPGQPTQVCSFSGHTDIVRCFDFRVRGPEDCQVVSWSKDQTLRVFNFEPHMQRLCGAAQTSPLPYSDAQSLLVSPDISLSPVDFAPSASAPGSAAPTPSFGSILSTGTPAMGNSLVLAPPPGRGASPGAVLQDANNMTLSQELLMLGQLAPAVTVEESGVRYCVLVMRASGCTARLRVLLPQLYPHNASPSFDFMPKTDISWQAKKELIRVLQSTALDHVQNSKVCIEPCVRAALRVLEGFGPTAAAGGIQWDSQQQQQGAVSAAAPPSFQLPLTGSRTNISKVISMPDLLGADSSSEEGDSNNLSRSIDKLTGLRLPPIAPSATARGQSGYLFPQEPPYSPFGNMGMGDDVTGGDATLDPDASPFTPRGGKTLSRSASLDTVRRRIELESTQPVPRTCGAVFSPSGALVVFNTLGDHQQALFATDSPIRTYHELRSAVSLVPSSQRHSEDRPTAHHHQGMSESVEYFSSFFLKDSVSDMCPLEFPGVSQATSDGGLVGSLAIDTRVHCFDATPLLPFSASLAREYRFCGMRASELCAHNAARAKEHSRPDLARLWGLVLRIATPLEEYAMSASAPTATASPTSTPLQRRVSSIEGPGWSPQASGGASTSPLQYQGPDGACGVHPWTLHPFSKSLFLSLVSHYAKLRDVQTVAAISCAIMSPLLPLPPSLTPLFSLIDPKHEKICNQARLHYAELLQRLGLSVQCAEILKFSDMFHAASRPLSPTALSPSSPVRPHAMSPAAAAAALPFVIDFEVSCRYCGKRCEKTAVCRSCKVHPASCVICNLSVRGTGVFCGMCGHGGHLRHVQDWFQQNSQCASGCGCPCLQFPGSLAAMIHSQPALPVHRSFPPFPAPDLNSPKTSSFMNGQLPRARTLAPASMLSASHTMATTTVPLNGDMGGSLRPMHFGTKSEPFTVAQSLKHEPSGVGGQQQDSRLASSPSRIKESFTNFMRSQKHSTSSRNY